MEEHMSEDLPFSAEYAKSARSACKTCGSLIPKDHVRIAVMVQSSHFDGKQPLWNHFNCFFRKNKVKSTGDINGFGSLRYEDQAKIKEKAGGTASIGNGTLKQAKRSHTTSMYYVSTGQSVSVDVSVEYAKSNRSTCKGCFTTIDKGLLRIGCLVDAEGEEMKWAQGGKKQAWHHPACFKQRREELEIEPGLTGDMLNGFKELKGDDKAELIILLGKGGKKKRKVKKETLPQSVHEKKLQAQSSYMLEIRQALKEVNNKYLREMLEANDYPTHGADIRLYDRCSDGIAFGRFDDPCTVCGGTYYSLVNNSYQCKGDVSEFTKCTNTLAAPKRVKWTIPKSVKEQSDYLTELKLKTGTRLFMEVEASTVVSSYPESIPPLKDYVFCSTLEKIELNGVEHDIQTVLEKHGGKLHKKFTAKCNALITQEVDSGGRMVKRATRLEIPVVDCEKLVKGLAAGELLDISTVCFSGYEGDDYVMKRRSIKSLKSLAKEEKSTTENSAKRAKITVQNGAEVFQESGLDGNPNVQVYRNTSGVVYAATLGQVDIAKGKNSYYKLQILKRGENSYDLFRAWGRIGTIIGDTTFDSFRSPNGAINLFEHHYADKSGNDWGEPFEKVAGKMYRIDLDYGSVEDVKDAVTPGSLTKLEPGIQALVSLIFDVNAMKDTLLQFELDLNKMPLGNISRNQLKSAFTVLTAVQDLIEEPLKNKIQILDASTRFFTLIPHDFGMQTPPILNTQELIRSKTEMLEALLELEIAFSMTRKGVDDEGKDPIDMHFLRLNCDMSILPRSTEEFSLLEKYVATTHAETHDSYDLAIENIFQVKREGEYERYASSDHSSSTHDGPYSSLHNRMLLWHGSRITNFAGILSQGLRIAPPEAPVTGYMFGKGVYFADMVSKSANYCNTTTSSPTGLLLLCEVALGDMYTLKESKYVKKLPKGKHSTKGLGRTGPSSFHTLPDGCLVPLGSEQNPDALDSSLLYNEYIVYDVAQVSVRYLVQLKFDYGSRGR